MRHNVLVRRRFFDEANKKVGLFGWARYSNVVSNVAKLNWTNTG